jgi:hypothetical protein
MTDRQFILENLKFRISSTYPGHSVNIGNGNAFAQIIIVCHAHETPERDGTTGALKRFGMLDDAYRVPMEIVSGISLEENRVLVKELIEIIKPLLVVTTGKEATEMLKNENLRSFKAQSGKGFHVEDLTSYRFHAILNPEDYSFARAPIDLKEQGRYEWQELATLFNKLHTQHENNRWKV